MKFLTKINRNYLLLFSISLLVISFAGYFILNKIIMDNTKENLLKQETLIVKQIEGNNSLPNLKPLIEVTELNEIPPITPGFAEINIYDSLENEQEPYIEYSNIVHVNQKAYLIKIREAAFESEDLAISIGTSILVLLLVAFGISFIITRRLNKTIWQSFEQNLKEMEQFDFRDGSNLSLQSSGIEEFDRLNRVVSSLTGKLKKDYEALQEFSENASHEIQSPLAIALLNLDELLQQDLSEEVFRKVIATIKAIQRLSQLNKNLLLLTKIGNKQFSSTKEVDFTALIRQKLEEFELLFRDKSLQVTFEAVQEFSLKMDSTLAGILVNNLLSNAVNHNIEQGHLTITIEQNKLMFCNTGPSNTLTNETIFNRFVKDNSKSYGLGLSIVKQICDAHQLEIQYSKNEIHCFTISRNGKNN